MKIEEAEMAHHAAAARAASAWAAYAVALSQEREAHAEALEAAREEALAAARLAVLRRLPQPLPARPELVGWESPCGRDRIRAG